MDSAFISKSVFLRAPVDRVWTFLTDPEALAIWFHPANRVLDEPGPYHYVKEKGATEPYCWGEVLEAERGKRLVHTFIHEWLEGQETRVEWTLTPYEEGTILSLVHEGFEGGQLNAFNALCSHDAGWDEHFVKLREAAAEQAAQPA